MCRAIGRSEELRTFLEATEDLRSTVCCTACCYHELGSQTPAPQNRAATAVADFVQYIPCSSSEGLSRTLFACAERLGVAKSCVPFWRPQRTFAAVQHGLLFTRQFPRGSMALDDFSRS
jgi:hypothetical protein